MSASTVRPSIDIHPSTNLVDRVIVEQPFRCFANVTLNNFAGGAFSYVAPGAQMHHVRLGRYCSIGDGMAILSKHPTDTLTTSPFPYQRIFPAPFDAAPVVTFQNLDSTVIGNDVWIGSGVRIKSGVRIGDGAIVGAGSVVTRDIPAFSVCAGAPARHIRWRFELEVREAVSELKWWQYNLIGTDLPWQHMPDLLDTLNRRIAAGVVVPYQSDLFSLFRDGTQIKCRIDRN